MIHLSECETPYVLLARNSSAWAMAILTMLMSGATLIDTGGQESEKEHRCLKSNAD